MKNTIKIAVMLLSLAVMSCSSTCTNKPQYNFDWSDPGWDYLSTPNLLEIDIYKRDHEE